MDGDGLRALLLLAAGGLLVALGLTWAEGGEEAGWTMYTPLSGDGVDPAVDRLFTEVYVLDGSGWEELGAWSALLVAAAVALVVPLRRVAAGLLVAAAVVTAVGGLSPEAGHVEVPETISMSERVQRNPSDGVWLTFVALGLGSLALAVSAWTARPRGAALLLGGAALLAAALLLRWEWVFEEPLVHPGNGLGFLGLALVPYLALTLAAVASAVRPDRRRDAALLAVTIVAAGLLCAFGFRGGLATGPYTALTGTALVALGLTMRLRPEQARGVALAGVAGAMVALAVPFLPWGAITGTGMSYGAIDRVVSWWKPGFWTTFDAAGTLWPLLAVPAAAAVVAALLSPARRPVLIVLAVAAGLTVAALVPEQSGDVYEPTTGAAIALAAALLCLAGLVSAALRGTPRATPAGGPPGARRRP